MIVNCLTHGLSNGDRCLQCDPYGVPTGGVPRTSGYVRVDNSMKLKPTPLPDLNDSLLAVIDRQLEIERKARAWDELRAQLFPSEARVLALMDRLVHPAQNTSTC